MLNLRWASDNLSELRAGLEKRGFGEMELLDRLEGLAQQRLESIQKIEALRQKRNESSQAMAQIKDKSSAEFQEKRASLKELSNEIKLLEASSKDAIEELENMMLVLPNLPDESTPEGKSEEDNVVLRTVGEKPEMSFEPKDHVDLGVALGILDFERATKIAASRFVIMRGLGARLERALMQYMLDMHTDEHGYTEVWPPVLVNDKAMLGTSQLPKFKKDAFRIAQDEEWAEESGTERELYLCPTAEVPVTNMHADEILEVEELPIAYTAFTPCFRSEAGSYGRDTRGMIRQHQFDKVEMVRFVRPEDAKEQHELLTSHAENILKGLGLHYRVVELCAGDMGFAAKKCFDIEVWLPAQNAFREISSCSWFGDFQARRMKCRYRPEPKAKPEFPHTINGSGLAIGRTVVAILEQYQNEDGSVTIPEALRPYMGGRDKITL